MFNFWGPIKLFSIMALPFYIPPAMHQVPVSLHSQKDCTFSGFCLVFEIIAILMSVKSYISYMMVLMSIFLMTHDVESFFMCHLYIFFREMFSQILWSFLNWVIYVLLLNCTNSLYNLDIHPLSEIYDFRYFSPILWVIFSLSW